MTHKKKKLIDIVYFLLYESMPYMLSPKRPLEAFFTCFILGLGLSWLMAKFFTWLPLPPQIFSEKVLDISLYLLSMIALPFILLKIYWSQLNSNRDHELRERELVLKEKEFERKSFD